ncbi:MAG: hypothetical protein WD967_00990 [Candidatus Levyibacteriota bacterium]
MAKIIVPHFLLNTKITDAKVKLKRAWSEGNPLFGAWEISGVKFWATNGLVL